MTYYLPELDPYSFEFPSPSQAMSEPNGLLAHGGDLQPKRLLNAYQHGIFPWYSDNDPIMWWSPTPRAIINPKTFKPAKSLIKFQKKSRYTVTINHTPNTIIELCASSRGSEETWITSEMISAYQALANQQVCHSVEVWDNQQLIGGLYGIQIGTLFCGESMFSLKSNASKIALWYFCHHFAKQGGELIDCQMMNPHLLTLGAIEQTRDEFMLTLHTLKTKSVNAKCYTKQLLTDPFRQNVNE